MFKLLRGVGFSVADTPHRRWPCSVTFEACDDMNVQLWYLITERGDVHFFCICILGQSLADAQYGSINVLLLLFV